MGCFCRNLPPLPVPKVDLRVDVRADLRADAKVGLPPVDPLLPALHAWLAARWLPAVPWHPDPAWLDIELPELKLPAASLSVILSLVEAARRCQLLLGVDLLAPAGAARLARIVATLNARVGLLAELVVDPAPWLELLQLEAQVRVVESAASLNLFAPPRLDIGLGVAPTGPWRLLLLRVKALAPLIAIGKVLKLDWTAPNAVDLLSARLRLLARIDLPPLADVHLVLQLIAQLDAVVRLRAIFGPHDHARIRAALALRMAAALRLVPPGIQLREGVLIGMPPLPPNPGLLLNLPTLRAAQLLTPQLVARMNWQVPSFDALALLTVGSPVATLVDCMVKLGVNPIRLTPCGPTCDAARAAAAAAAPPLPRA